MHSQRAPGGAVCIATADRRGFARAAVLREKQMPTNIIIMRQYPTLFFQYFTFGRKQMTALSARTPANRAHYARESSLRLITNINNIAD